MVANITEEPSTQKTEAPAWIVPAWANTSGSAYALITMPAVKKVASSRDAEVPPEPYCILLAMEIGIGERM